MKQIELFYLTHCPYCVYARRAIEELREEQPAYREIEIRWIEETEEAELADSRDYYYVPTLYYDGVKRYEAKPTHSRAAIKQHIRDVFDSVLSA